MNNEDLNGTLQQMENGLVAVICSLFYQNLLQIVQHI